MAKRSNRWRAAAGGEQQQVKLQGPPPTLEGDSDVTVLGKIKRRF